ncbi:MAG: glycoside hydrolase family 3 C-terminal domain-containing protein [Prevotella sp.]|nr:glycoside hydrolase family 3 C-terminal domain-containing protein [Prevotella sp.]
MKQIKILTWTLMLMMGITTKMAAQTLPYQNTSLSFHERAVDLVSRLTLTEKAQQMGNMVDQVVDRDGIYIPMYQYWNEALHGVAREGAATCFPESKGMSSTWDRQLIYDCASVISDEARVYHNLYNKGLNYWCPTINMARDPRWGRDEENYGEDPFLAGQLAVQFIKGMQGNDSKYLKTVACAKHFAANNYEQGRQGSTSYMTKHILREYYLPAFEMSVKEGGVKSIMSSYNALSTDINETNAAGVKFGDAAAKGKAWGGKPNAMNDWLLTGILRNEWGFDGYVTSDCAGVSCIYRNVKHCYYGPNDDGSELQEDYKARATADAIKAGNDMNCEFKNQTSVFQTAIEAAIDKGYMTEEDLDRALIRVLETRFALGEFDTTNPWSGLGEETLESEANQALALKAAQESIVLLKNDIPEGGSAPLLPLTTDKKVAIIGPYANAIMYGDYSGVPSTENTSTPFQAIANKMNFSVSDGTHNFTDYDRLGYAKRGEDKFKGAGVVENTSPGDWIVFDEIDFGDGCANFVVNCATKTNNGEGTVNFYLDLDDADIASATTDNAALSISNSSIAAGGWTTYADVTADVDATIFKGKHKVTIKFLGSQSYVGNWKTFRFYNEGVEPLETQGPVYMVETTKLVYSGTNELHIQNSAVNDIASDEMIARAVAVAQKADVVVFVGGTDFSKPADHATGTESHDRWQLTLPGNQEAVLQAVHAVNSNVILVLESNSSMDITWEKSNLPAIIEAWYGGQAQGQAICDVLYGDVNPSGKLTSTWYNRIEELPSASDSQFGANGMLEYNIDDWGYTYMYYGKGTGANVNRQAAAPMYPFGYGLSYTTFDYSNPSISSSQASCTVTNTGNCKGAEVVQVYVSFPNSQVPHMQNLNRRLVGFERVELEAGQSTIVTIPINKKQLAYWNETDDAWWVEGGQVNVYISASSADDRLTGSFVATAEKLVEENQGGGEEPEPEPEEPVNGISIPTATGSYISWDNSSEYVTITGASVENDGANIGSTGASTVASFTIGNSTKQDYMMSFGTAAKNLTGEITVTLTNSKDEKVLDEVAVIENTGSWYLNGSEKTHSYFISQLPVGTYTLTLATKSTTGSYAGNWGKLAFRTVESVPGGIDLYTGSYSNCSIDADGIVGNMKATGSTATYDFNVTKAGPYNFSWGVRKNAGGTVNVKIYQYGTTTVDLEKDITIPDGNSSYPTFVDELGTLTTGMKTMVLTFTSATDKWPCNFTNLALRYTGADLNLYNFNLNVTGAPASLITVKAVPEANADGKYEEGTLITLKAVNNTLFNFQKWSDETTAATKTIKLKANTDITATYTELESYLAGWDFSKGYTANADYAKREENESASLYLVNTDGSTASGTYWNRGGYAQIWMAGELDYVARLNARNYKDITVQSKLNYNYNVWPTTKMQYSVDGTTWTDIDGASLTFTANGWQSLNATLPAACDHAEKLYLRWASVREGDLIGSTSDYRALQIKDIYVLGDYETYQDMVAPTVTYTTPSANSQLAKREGTITLNFDKNVVLNGQAMLNGQQLTGEVFGSRITFPYSGLNSNTEYTFTLPAGTVANDNDVVTDNDFTLTFKTVARNTVATKHAFDFVVGTDGTADEAIAAANASNADRYYIFVPNGEWKLTGNDSGDGNKTNVTKTVSIIGQSQDGAVLWNESEGYGISNTSTLNLRGEHSYLQDLTVKNWRGQGDTGVGVAVALSERGYNIYKNVAIWSNQDTYVSSGTNYWEGGSISGSVDYICGGGNIWFEGTELLNTRAGSVITAPETDVETLWGYVFNNCSVGSYYTEETVPTGASVCTNGGYTFGRPWQKAPRTTMLNTICDILPTDAGWQGMGDNTAFHFNEFGSVSKTGMLLDLSGRNVAGLNQDNPECDTNPVLTQAEAAAFTLDAVMGNDFTPTAYTEQCDAPVVTLDNKTLSWTDDAYALCYVIFRNGEYVANVTTNTYVATTNGSYTVCAANAMGGLSEASNTVTIENDAATFTIHGLGDSTATEQAETGTMRGWIQVLQQFFDNSTATIRNHAKSGQSSKSFYNELWTTAKANVNAGDIVIISFAHNDEANQTIDGDELKAYYESIGSDLANTITTRGTNPTTTYKQYLRLFIEETKAKGAYPVMVSPICRKMFTNGVIRPAGRHNLYQNFDKLENNTLTQNTSLANDDHTKDYVYQMQQVAQEYQGVPFIDLTSETETIFNNYGDTELTANRIFCGTDGTHLGLMGATITAQAFAKLVKAQAGSETDAQKKYILERLAGAVTEADKTMSFAPASGDMGKCYVGQSMQKAFSASCFGLDNATGDVSLSVTGGYELSIDGGETWSNSTNTTYDVNTLIQNIYVRINATEAGTVNGQLSVTADGVNGQLALSIEAIQKASGSEMYVVYPLDGASVNATTHGYVTAEGETLSNVTCPGNYAITANGGFSWPEESGIEEGQNGRRYQATTSWAAGEIDENNTRYIQWSVQLSDADGVSAVDIDEIGLYLTGRGVNDMCAKVYYSTDPNFTQEASTNIVWLKSIAAKSFIHVVDYPVMKLQPGERLYIRVYPYRNGLGSANASGDIMIRNVTIHGWSPDILPEYRTVAQWDFRTKTGFDVTDGKYTPNSTALDADIEGSQQTEVPTIYPATYYGCQNNYEMTFKSYTSQNWSISKSGYFQYQTSNNSNGADVNFTDADNHKNYYQFSFSTKGYKNVEMEWSETTNRSATEKAWALHTAYSTDGGTTWTDLGEQSMVDNEAYKAKLTATIPGSYENVIVRILPTLDWRYQLKYLKLTGEINPDVLPTVILDDSNAKVNFTDCEADVKLTRSIKAGKWSTIVVPFDISADDIETVFGQGASVAELESGDATSLHFSTTLTDDMMKANQPYAIKVGSDFTGALISGATIVEATPVQSIDNWDFVGTYATVENLAAGNYYFKNNYLWQATGTQRVKAFRAYLHYTGGSSLAPQLSIIIDGDETTGINALDSRLSTLDKAQPRYNIAGQRVSENYKGIVIVNGKKIIRK